MTTLQVCLAIWTHCCFEGRYDGPFLISSHFGVPSALADAGIRPTITDQYPQVGWDGQFYFFMANDPLGLADTAEHLDTITYRYQRIGIPALAWGISRITGHSVTSAFWYLTVQNILVAAGFGVLVGYLSACGISAGWAMTWLGAGGTWYTLAYGLPDAAADGVFIIAFWAVITGRLWGYLLASTLLVLIREGYVLFPFAVFLATVWGKLDWSRSWWTRSLLTTIPGIAVIAWAVYLSVHFGIAVTSPERNPSITTGLPGVEFWKSLRHAWEICDRQGVVYRLISMASLITILVIAARHCRRHLAFAVVLPYLLLMLCLGPVVWQHHQGYFKAMGTVLIVGILLLTITPNRILKGILVLNLLIGIDWNLIQAIIPAPFFSPNSVILTDMPPSEHPFGSSLNDIRGKFTPFPDVPNQSPLRSMTDEIEWMDARETVATEYQGIWRYWHRELVPFPIRIHNRGTEAWSANPRLGTGAVHLVAELLPADRSRTLMQQRVPLPRSIEPGESLDLLVWIRLGNRQIAHLHLAMEQVGVHPFNPHTSTRGLHRVIRIR
ncbi:hypothetical protein [Tuwongella immobilis]|uniref:hypothetical protein n=1 Tax=Tuwongella immobilis TaxID=692036 RepID=UPI001E4A8DDA|nr:hypothetical protein [Tuwongella immobilis]